MVRGISQLHRFLSSPWANRAGLRTPESSVLGATSQLRQAEAFSYLSTQLARQGCNSLGHLIKVYWFYGLQSFLLLDKLLSKAKESYLPLSKGLLELAKDATLDSGGQEHPHSHSRLKLLLVLLQCPYYYYYYYCYY